jgi:hypothetical protein
LLISGKQSTKIIKNKRCSLKDIRPNSLLFFMKTNLTYFSFLIFLISSATAKAQETYVCNYQGKAVNETAICDMLAFQSRPEASQAVEKIVKRSGLKQNFYIMECPKIDNCFAVTREGERMIVYDASFMKKVNNLTNTDWGAMSILAHEIGHHLQGHTLKSGGSEQKKELEADEFSGFVMYQMGATLKEAQSAIKQLTSDYDSGTHPPRSQRLGAIEAGYRNAEELYPRVINNDKRQSPKEINTQPEVINIPNEEINKIESRTGCLSGNCTNGYGIAINRNTLEKYAGSWNEGKRNGKGVEFYANQQKKYEGDFRNGTYNGKGVYYFKNGDSYKGGFLEGEMHGNETTYNYQNGDILIINYKNGKKEGWGKLITRSGYVKKVFFKNDQPY